MKPKNPGIEDRQGNFLETELEEIIDLKHPLIQLSHQMNWNKLDDELGAFYVEDVGCPGKPTRLMCALQYLKYTYKLSDEEVIARWVENPYWQYFSGEKYFQHNPPIHPTSLTKWRQRIGEEGVECLFAATTEAGMSSQVIKTSSLEKLNVDTTVQEKVITYPTDAKLYEQMRKLLVNKSLYCGIELRQTYPRVFKKYLRLIGKYFHSRKPKQAKKYVKMMKVRLERIVRDMERKVKKKPDLQAYLEETFALARRLLEQKKNDTQKIYSIHALEVECISKGKAHKKYEFGNKVGIVATSKEGFIIGVKSFHGNPYDGHTLNDSLTQAEKVTNRKLNGAVFVDKGYRGHNYQGEASVYISGRKRLKDSLKKWLKRRSVIEATIGHMKQSSCLDRNYLKGDIGDKVNAILSACGWNLHLILAKLAKGSRRSRSFLLFFGLSILSFISYHRSTRHQHLQQSAILSSFFKNCTFSGPIK